jgi:alkylation response protein AidB-like acyl-CoA dehydrogenase
MLGTLALAGRVLLHSPPSPARQEALAGLCAGELVASAVLDREPSVTAVSEVGSGTLLTGHTGPVPDADEADALVVCARTEDGPVLCLVHTASATVVRTRVPGIDLTRGLARFELTRAPAQRLVGPEHLAAAVDRGRAEAVVLLAAESVGGARAALDEMVAYSKMRSQFGRPIGSFQALKHRMADVLINVEGAWSAVRHAAAVADVRDPIASVDELELAAGTAKSTSSRAQLFAAGENIQIHGGIGFTWEHTAHLRFRRAKSSEVLLGLPRAHDARAVRLLGYAPHLGERGGRARGPA